MDKTSLVDVTFRPDDFPKVPYIVEIPPAPLSSHCQLRATAWVSDLLRHREVDIHLDTTSVRRLFVVEYWRHR